MGFKRASLPALVVFSMLVAGAVWLTPAAAQTFPDYTSQDFVDLYDSLSLPNTTQIATPPSITGDAAADARIRSIAESRGYRLRTQAGGGLVSVSGQSVQPPVASAWGQMSSAAAAEGVSITLTSAYRTVASQRSILLGRLSGWSNAQIASGAADGAIFDALRLVSVPGYSKHHSGYAIDVVHAGGGLAGFENTPSYAWLSANNFANAKRFGFVPSYPYGAAPFGPDPEPWELVWVGANNIAAGGGDQAPIGWFDAAFFDASGVSVVGWALDHDTGDPQDLHVYANGGFVGSVRADRARPDVASVLGVGPNHGFNGRFGLGPGYYTVCIYAISRGSAGHTPLGCMEGEVTDASPVGYLDAAFFEADRLSVVGWALDHDTAGQQAVHVYIDDAFSGAARADRTRSDVASALGVGPDHGFNADFAVGAGTHTVCVYAISLGAAPHTPLGCVTG